MCACTFSQQLPLATSFPMLLPTIPPLLPITPLKPTTTFTHIPPLFPFITIITIPHNNRRLRSSHRHRPPHRQVTSNIANTLNRHPRQRPLHRPHTQRPHIPQTPKMSLRIPRLRRRKPIPKPLPPPLIQPPRRLKRRMPQKLPLLLQGPPPSIHPPLSLHPRPSRFLKHSRRHRICRPRPHLL